MKHVRIAWRTAPALAGLALLGGIAAGAGTQTTRPAVAVTTKDIAGKALKIPHASSPTLVLFLRTDQDQSRRILADAKKALEGLSPVQVVAIFSGSQDPQAVKKFVSALPCRIVLDEQYEMVGRFNARVWPTSLVVTTDGNVLVRLTGLPQTYVRDLNAYLAFALKKIDRKTLQQRVATPHLVADSPRQMAERHLRVAERLMQKDLLRQALQELERGLKLMPGDPRLRLAKAQALLLLQDPDGALSILKGLDEKSALGARINTVKGGAMVAKGLYDQAVPVLELAAKLNPDRAETLYFLGLAYQHRKQWPEAAKAFRAAFEATPAGRRLIEPGGKQPGKAPAATRPAK